MYTACHARIKVLSVGEVSGCGRVQLSRQCVCVCVCVCVRVCVHQIYGPSVSRFESIHITSLEES